VRAAILPTILRKPVNFWQIPLFGKLYSLSILYYRLKGVLLYRLLFKKFGMRSYIRKPLLILKPAYISVGDRVSVRDGVRLEVIDSNQERIPELVIEDDTNIEQNVHIVCHDRIRIGRNVSIAGNCSIVDVTHPYLDVHDPMKIGSRILDEPSFVEIGDGSFIGFGAVILPNIKLGKNVVIGANSVVTRDIPDYCVAAGAPARILKRYNFTKKVWESVTTLVST